MLSGRSRMDWKNPTTPGSSRPGQERTSTEGRRLIRVLARTAARTRSQLLNRMSIVAAKPHAQTTASTTGVQSCAGFANDVEGDVPGNCCDTCKTVKAIPGVGI